jgi:hypothetical protein
MADPIKFNPPAITPFMSDAEIDKAFGAGFAKQYRQQLLEKQQAYEADSGALDEALTTPINQRQFREELMQQAQGAGDASVPMPQGNARGGVRGRYESPLEFENRMNRERGPRGSFSGGGLDAFNAMQDRGLTVDEAGRKAGIVRSQGGRINADGTMSKAGARPAPKSSTGRDYDPVAERKNMLADAGAAVAERKNLQASDLALLQKQEAAARTPGTMRGFANKYGSGQAKTLTPEEFAKRKEATITEGRHNPVTNSMREVLGWMNKDQQAEGMPALDTAQRLKESDAMRKAFDLNQKNYLKSAGEPFRQMANAAIKPKMNGGEVNPDISTMITGEDGPELQFRRKDGSLFVIPADITAKITAGLEMEDSEDGKESLRAIKGGKVKPKMNGGMFDEQQKMSPAWVKEYRNTLTGMRGGTPMPGINAGMSPYAATLTAVRGGIPMPGVR